MIEATSLKGLTFASSGGGGGAINRPKIFAKQAERPSPSRLLGTEDPNEIFKSDFHLVKDIDQRLREFGAFNT